jgi:hypothetical protein
MWYLFISQRNPNRPKLRSFSSNLKNKLMILVFYETIVIIVKSISSVSTYEFGNAFPLE